MINTLTKALLGATYLLALASLFVVLPMEAGPVVQKLALALLGVHVLECLLAFKYVKSYPGPLWVSVLLALLFGLLHWMPLAKAARLAAADKTPA
jgi:uncharacterized protein YhhL (DUF1145 family)